MESTDPVLTLSTGRRTIPILGGDEPFLLSLQEGFFVLKPLVGDSVLQRWRYYGILGPFFGIYDDGAIYVITNMTMAGGTRNIIKLIFDEPNIIVQPIGDQGHNTFLFRANRNVYMLYNKNLYNLSRLSYDNPIIAPKDYPSYYLGTTADDKALISGRHIKGTVSSVGEQRRIFLWSEITPIATLYAFSYGRWGYTFSIENGYRVYEKRVSEISSYNAEAGPADDGPSPWSGEANVLGFPEEIVSCLTDDQRRSLLSLADLSGRYKQQIAELTERAEEQERLIAELRRRNNKMLMDTIQEKDLVTCSICYSNPISMAITPCGHMFCTTCVVNLREPGKEIPYEELRIHAPPCPHCRGPIRGTQKIYFTYEPKS